MVAPTRYPSGISVYKAADVRANFPAVGSASQDLNTVNFFPYLPSAFTASTAGTATQTFIPYNGGLTALNCAAISSYNYLALTGNQAAGQNLQFVPGQQLFFHTTIALSLATYNSTSLTSGIICGLVDTANPNSLANGVYFTKATTSTAATNPNGSYWQTPLNLVIKNGASTTTITNIGDLAKPSGLFGDTSSYVGTVGLSTSGTTANTPTVTYPGGGYAQAPYTKVTGSVGSNAAMWVQIGSNYVTGGGGLYNPIVTNPGSGYTAGSFATEADHFIDLSLYFDGKDTLSVGINGRKVLSIGAQANPVNGLVVGSSNPLSTYSSNALYVPTSSLLTTTTFAVPPGAGNVLNILPLVPLNAAVGVSTTTAAAANMYVAELDISVDNN